MNRTVKKIKLDGNTVNSGRKTGYSMIHSGHYMTSCLHDNENDDDTVEMPIASPDATNNDVTAAAAELEASTSVKSASTTAMSSEATNENEDIGPVSSISRVCAAKSDVVSVAGAMNGEIGTVSEANNKTRRLLLKAFKNVPRSNVESIQANLYENQVRDSDKNSKIEENGSMGGYPNNITLMENFQDAMENARKNMFAILCAQQGSISGGLTLDKANKSLIKLIFYIKTSYSNNLTSPKWKNFKGLKLQVTEKIRINNVIWRSWFEQYGIRDSLKRKRRLICQFSSGLDETSSSLNCLSSSGAITAKTVRENKFWKARLESITNEYKKWRELSRKQIKATIISDGITTLTAGHKLSISDKRNSVNGIGDTLKVSNYQADKTVTTSHLGAINVNPSISASVMTSSNVTTPISIFSSTTGNASASTSIFNSTSNSHTNANSSTITGISSNSNLFSNSNQIYITNASNELINNELASQQNCTANSENFSNFQASSTSIPSFNTFSTNGYSNNSLNNNTAHSVNFQSNTSGIGNIQQIPLLANSNGSSSLHHHSPASTKQIHFNNRCRSPSPGLFQDIDLYNFSSDTLFSTYLVEDTKDPVFGTNPDFFQPDLMHLYPNFDFFELCDNDFMSTTTINSSIASVATKSESKLTTLIESHASQSLPPEGSISQTSFTASSQPTQPASASVQVNLTPNYSRNQSSNYEHQAHLQNIETINLTISTSAGSFTSQGSNGQQSSCSKKFGNMLYSTPGHLSNFDTLVNVASAQSPAIAQKQTQSALNPNENSLIQYSNRRSNAENQISNSTSTNTIRNLLGMNSVTSDNSLMKSECSLASSAKLYDGSNTVNSSHSLSTSLTKPKSTAEDMSNMSLQNTSTSISHSMIDDSVVSSLSQILEKNSANNKSKIIPINNAVEENNQTINSLLAVLNASSTRVENTYSESASPEAQQLIKDHSSVKISKNRRGRKTIDPLNSSSNSRFLSLETKPNSTPIKINQKKDKDSMLECGSIDKSSSSGSFQHHNPSLRNQQISSSIYDLIVNPNENLATVVNTSSIENGLGNSIGVNISSSPSNSSSSNSNSQYNQSDIFSSGRSNTQQTQPQITTGGTIYAVANHVNSNSGDPNDFVLTSKVSNNFSSTILYGSTSLEKMNRSNSVSSINTMTDTNMTNAEQKRRCNIQHGFDRLQVLVPALLDGKNAKVSKAVMLQKTSEYIKELQLAREKRLKNLAEFKCELEELSGKISECQSQLPASGVAVTGQLNKIERFEQKFTSYIKEKTMENWRFYIFSLILRPLFETFLSNVTTSSKEDMERSFTQWQQKSCNLTQLRPIASNALRHLVKTTTILTDASNMAEECLAEILPKI